MNFKCEDNDEYINFEYCKNDCDKEECYQYDEIKRKQENAKKIQDSELKKEVIKTLSKTLGLDDEHVVKIVDNMFSDLVHYTEKTMQDSIKTLIQLKIQEIVENKIDVKINELFEKALSNEILKIDSENISIIKVQKDMEKRIISFLNNGYDRRKTLDSSVDNAISAIAHNKVSDVLKEIKEEAIDKFNKEMMKKMMTGMAGAIGDDKRLLNMLEL